MAIGTNPRVARMLVQYWSGSAWTNLADSDGVSRVLNLSITDTLNNPRYVSITLFNPRASGQDAFGTGDFNTVVKNKMKIRLVDQTTFSILFLGQVDNIVPENSLKGYTLTITAYDSLIELTQNILKKDFLNDSDRSESPAVLNNDFISEDIDELIDYGSFNRGTGNRSIEVVNTTDSDDAGAFRFQKSLGKTNTRDKDFSASGGSYLNAIKRLAELESGIEATASAKITGGLKPYNFYVDTNFQTTATNTEGSGNFFNYFPAGCMPAAAQSGTSYTLANPADDGLTLMFGTGSAVTETGQTLKLLPSFSFEDLARERVTHLTAHFKDPISGYAKDLEFEVFNYKSISSGAGLQDIYEPSGTDTGGTETGKTLEQTDNIVKDTSGNTVGFLQYISNVSGAGFALLSGTTGTDGSIRHSVAAGEQLNVSSSGGSALGNFTLSDTTDPNGSDIFRPQEVFQQKILRNFSINTGDLLTFRRAVAAAFENKDTRRVRAKFSLASGYPYHFVEGQVNSVSTNTITDSTIVNQHSTTTDGLASANIDSFPTAGIRTGMVLHKLTGENGTMSEYGYIEKTEDNSLTADLTNSATFSTNDYYRVYVPLRVGHTVQIKNTAIDSSLFNHVVTSITYEEGEQGFMTYLETVGDISNPKALTAGVRVKPSTAPIDYDDETYSDALPLANQNPVFTGEFKPGNTSDNNLNTAIQYTAGTFSVDGFDHTISAGDSEDATHGVDGGADHSGTAFADSTQYVIFFDPAISTSKFQIRSNADYEKQAQTAAGGSGNASSAFQGDLIRLGSANKASQTNAEAPFELTNLETPNSNFKLDAQSISANCITASLIAADTITAAEMAADSITADEIVAAAITSKHTITGATIQTSSNTSADRVILDANGIDVISSGASSTILDIFHRSGSTATGIGAIYSDSGQWNLASFDGSTRTSVISIAKRGTTIGSNSAVLFINGITEFVNNVFMQGTLTADSVTVSSTLQGGGSGSAIGTTNTSTSFGKILMGGGFATAPAFSFSATSDMGMYRYAEDYTGFSGNSNLAAYIGATTSGNGAVFTHFYTFMSDTNTFIASTGSDVIQFTTGGTHRVSIQSSGILSEEGSNSAPGYSFVADPDTGIYNTANTLNMTFGGTARVHFGNAAFGSIDADIFTLGDIEATGDIKHGGSIISSDIAYKSDIIDIPYGLDVIDKLKPKEYTADYDNKRHIGLIAQDVKELLPDLDVASGKEGTLGLRYEELTAILIKSVQELKQEINDLKENR
jgi:hypothetical protein